MLKISISVKDKPNQLNKTKFLTELTLSADRLSYGVRTSHAVSNHVHQRLCALEKSQTLTAIPLFGHTKMLHTLVAMAIALLLRLLCLTLVKRHEFPAYDDGVNKN